MMRYLLLLFLGVLAGCQYGLPQVNGPSDVWPGDRVLVGKVVLDPPLVEGEQNIGERYEDFHLFTGQEAAEFTPDELGWGDFQNTIKAPVGETFYTIAPGNQAHINGGMLMLTLEMDDRLYFPGGWYYSAEAGSEALYIGTIKYTRNDFYETESVEIIDEYPQARKAFAKKFGDMPLKKALLQPAQ